MASLWSILVLFQVHLPRVGISLTFTCFTWTAHCSCWSFVVIKNLASFLSFQVIGSTRVLFQSDILPRPLQYHLKSLCSVFIINTVDFPFYSTSDIYIKKKCFLSYSMQNFYVLLVKKLLCYTDTNSTFSLLLKHIVLYTNIDLG